MGSHISRAFHYANIISAEKEIINKILVHKIKPPNLLSGLSFLREIQIRKLSEQFFCFSGRMPWRPKSHLHNSRYGYEKDVVVFLNKRPKKTLFFIFSFTYVWNSVNIPVCLPEGKRKPPLVRRSFGGAGNGFLSASGGYSGEPQ
jgi:hypothetical protein